MLRAARASASSRLAVATASASASTSRRVLVQASCAASSSRSISSSARLCANADQQHAQASRSGSGSGSSKGNSSKWYHRIKKQASNVLGLSSQQASVAAPMAEPKQESNSSAGSSQPQPLTEARHLEKAASARDDGHFAAALRSTAGTIRERQRLAKQRRQRQHRQNKGERKQAALGGKDEAAAAGQDGARETKAEPTQPAASTSAQPKEEKGSSSQGEAKSSSQSSPSSSSSQPPPPPPRAQGTGRVKRKNQPGRKERDYKAVREAAAAKGEKLTKKQVKALAESLRQQRVAEKEAKAEAEAGAEAASDGKQAGPSGKQQQQQQQDQKQTSAPSMPRQWAKAKAKEPEHDIRHEATSSTSAPAAAESDPPEAAASSPTRTYRKRPPHLGVAPAPRTRLVEGDEAEQLRNISSSLYTPEEDWEQLDPSDRALNGSSSSPDSIPLRKGGILRADAIPVTGIDGLREMKVATLAHGLDRVLFNPGVHQLRDPRSGIYNYPPHLRQIPDVDLFDYGALPAYVTSSADMELIEIAQKQGARFCGSTSSLTSIFSHCYFLLSGWKAPEVKDFSHEFRGDAVPKGFSFAAKLPATINFTPKTTPGDSRAVYAIDSNSTESGSDENSNYVLLQLGKAMEKMLTVDREEFDSFLRVNRPDAGEEDPSSTAATPPAEPEKEAYYYSRAGNHFVMRSQLDCHDSRLPRKTFDLKSRACVSIRYDRANWVEASGYQIKHLNGLWESFERERYDMTRSAFLKYYFQGRIGNMDGIFVAYHNAARFFGFEYFPLEEMAKSLFGTEEMAEQAFKLCIGLTERVLDRAAELYPGMPLRVTFETAEPLRANSSSSSISNEQSPPPDTMRVWIRPRGADGEPLPDQITQLDVVVDRYIFGRLVQGPVDFAAVDEGLDKEHSMAGEGLPSSSTGSKGSDYPLTRRPTDWHVEYSMAARTDLSPSEARANLEAALGRTKQLAALITPNVEAINERERRLEAELARNPDALLKYKRDKHSGVAAGMPRARGQVELFALEEDEIEVDESGDVPPEDSVELAEAASAAGPDGVTSSAATTTTSEEIDEMARVVRSEQKATPPTEDLGERDDMWKPPTMLVTAMRIKSQRGAREARELEERDRLVEFESTSARERKGKRA